MGKLLSLSITLLILLSNTKSFAANSCRQILTSLENRVLQRQASTQKDLVNPVPQAHSMMRAALEKNFKESHKAEAAMKLLKMGVPPDQVDSLVKPALRRDLDTLESAGKVSALSHEQKMRLLSGPSGARKHSEKTLSLREFADVYQLEPAILLANEVLSFRDSMSATRDVSVTEVLRNALLTGDAELITRAKMQAFRHNNQGDLIGIAAQMRDDAMLMALAETNLVRFLFFERNPNWLHYSLKAFVEIQGPNRPRAESMLYDLFDLMNSPSILEGVNKVAMSSGVTSQDYVNSSLDVLLTTLKLSHRIKRDSVTYHYVMEPTASPAYLTRVKAVTKKIVQTTAGVAAHDVISVIALTKDNQFKLEMAERFFDSRVNISKEIEDRYRNSYVNARLRTAFGLVMAAGSEVPLRQFLKKLAEDPEISDRASPFFVTAPANQYFSKELVEKLRVLGPALLTNETARSKALLSSLKEFFYYLDSTAKEKTSSASAHILFEGGFKHDIERAQSLLEDSKKIMPEKREELRQKGEGDLASGDLWNAYLAFSYLRDVPGLMKVYTGMMENGRGVDAVEVMTMIILLQGKNPELLRLEQTSGELLAK